MLFLDFDKVLPTVLLEEDSSLIIDWLNPQVPHCLRKVCTNWKDVIQEYCVDRRTTRDKIAWIDPLQVALFLILNFWNSSK